MYTKHKTLSYGIKNLYHMATFVFKVPYLNVLKLHILIAESN